MRRRFVRTALAGTLLAGAAWGAWAPHALAAGAAEPGDFNGDGKVDLVAGAPGVGVVAAFNGNRLPGRLVTRDVLGLPASDQSGGIGRALASGDFDGDGFADLALGVPQESLDVDGDGYDEAGVGAVAIVYGSRSGLDTGRTQVFTQASPGVPSDPSQGEGFGGSLAAADFNGDGRADLAIGSYGDQDDRRWAGSVTVLRGGAQGLSGADAQYVVNDVDAYQFGLRLAAGDVDGDGVADLVQVSYTGTLSRVIGYRGGGDGLDTAGAFTKDLPGYTVNYTSVAVGDLNGDHQADLAVGDSQYGSTTSGGEVAVLLSQGGTLGDAQVITQDSPGVPDTSEGDDRFGESLAIGDVDHDGRAELAIGAPGESLETNPDAYKAGAVTLLRGSSTGITTKGARWFTQDTAGIPDSAEVADLFGSAVSLNDNTGDGKADLAIGAAQERVGDNVNAGSVTVLKGATTKNAKVFDLSLLGSTDLFYAGFGSTLLH